MSDLIDRQAAIDAIQKLNIPEDMCVFEIMSHIEVEIATLPSVQPKHGEWEYHSNPNIGINPETAYCSCCGLRVDTTGDIDFDEYNFCPRCGVRMEM